MALPLLGLLARALVGSVGSKGGLLSASLTTNFHEKFSESEVEEIVDELGQEMEQRIIARTTREDTGAMKGGWSIAPSGSGYSRNFHIENSQDYTIHHEYGTYKMSAIPMVRPTLEEAQDILNEVVQKHK